jgi:hypothetical protein
MLKHFRIAPFVLGLVAGYGLFVFYKTEMRIIYEYPHPTNVDTRTYKDKNGVCYSYTAKEVNCDQHEGNLRPYPIQS